MNTALLVKTKRALQGDQEVLLDVLEELSKYIHVPLIKATCYGLIYQYVMNNLIDLSRECMECGGICCKYGELIPLYDFDIQDLGSRGIEIKSIVIKKDNGYYLPRPCPLQADWRCTVHEVKPFSCLSYPFMVEDLQLEVFLNYEGIGPPQFNIPSFCRAGIKVLKYVNRVFSKLGTDVEPITLLRFILRNWKQVL